jgi:vacuolar-type H+-ATPase subunit C/Vma6
MEPRTEGEFMIMLVQQVEQIHKDLSNIQEILRTKGDKDKFDEIDAKVNEVETLLASMKHTLEQREEREALIKQLEEEAKELAVQAEEQKLRDAKLRTEKSNRTKAIVGIISTIIIIGLMIYFYTEQ